MRDKEKQDGLVGFAIGGVLTLLASVFLLYPLSADWWVYLLVFLFLSGASMKALQQNRGEAKVAYDKGVAVKPVADNEGVTVKPVTGGERFCTLCGKPVSTGANFCAKCGAKLT